MIAHLVGPANRRNLPGSVGDEGPPAQLYKVGNPLGRGCSGKWMAFTHLGEQWLDMWLNENALVCWTVHPEPWHLEHELLDAYTLPLNIQDDRSHPFCASFSEARRAAKELARKMAIAN